MFCGDRLKLLSGLKIFASAKDGKEEVAKDLVAFYGFQNRILKVNF